ncbi:MAG TPA: hypothetical protein VGE52_17035, partial [Pirellulales bacterium]
MPAPHDAELLAPLVERLPPEIDAPEAFRRLSHLPNLVWFDSARRHPTLGRYSYISARPLSWQEFAAPDRRTPAAALTLASRSTRAQRDDRPT